MAESSVNLELRFWLKNPHQEVPIEYEYTERIKKALDAAGIEIPYPHRSLFVERLPSLEGSAGEAREPGPGEAREGETGGP